MASRHRTYWIVRRRYRQAGYLASVMSTALAAIYLVPLVHGAEVAATAVGGGPLGAIAILVLAAILPSLVARILWRIHRRRYFDDLYPLGVV